MSRKILVVDDELPILTMLEAVFSSQGYTVFTADSGEAGLRLLKKESVPCMFLDLNLPGMDGLELCRRIRRDDPISVVHAMTGYNNLFLLFHCREAGFDDYFLKPLQVSTMLEAAGRAYEKLDRWKRLREDPSALKAAGAE